MLNWSLPQLSQLHPIFSIMLVLQFPDQGPEQNARDPRQQRELRAQWRLPYRGRQRWHLWHAIRGWAVAAKAGDKKRKEEVQIACARTVPRARKAREASASR